MSKGQLNIKLSTATIAQIKALAAQRGESQANVVSIAVDRMAQAEENNMDHALFRAALNAAWADIDAEEMSARHLADACWERMIPVVREWGGKDPSPSLLREALWEWDRKARGVPTPELYVLYKEKLLRELTAE